MDCAQFQEVLHELDRPGTEGETQCERALAHAEMLQRLRGADDGS